MKLRYTLGLGLILVGLVQVAMTLDFPKRIQAGSAFSLPTSGNGKAVLYIAGPAQVLRRNVRLGENIVFSSGELHNAGHLVAILVGPSSSEQAQFDVVPAPQPATMSFLAKPSRLPVDLHDGISGVVYVFDIFRNLIVDPLQVSFQLSGVQGSVPSHVMQTHDGVAWVKLYSPSKAGAAQFQATVGNVTDARVIQLVPGDPCNLRMSARQSGQRIELQTDPVRDCSGNSVPDGTIVSFTETYDGDQATVDVPLKRGVARTDVPAHDGAVISVATGVVMGNEIRWGAGQR
jgi:hypothetical protein